MVLISVKVQVGHLTMRLTLHYLTTVQHMWNCYSFDCAVAQVKVGIRTSNNFYSSFKCKISL